MKHVCKSLVALVLLSACGQSQLDSNTSEAWNQRNNPEIMGIDSLTNKYQYENNFDKLPLTGELPQTPWSDYYWPTYQGGLTYRWAQDSSDQKRFVYETKAFDKLTKEEIAVLSPAEKYDLYMGFEDYRFTQAERDRTGVLKRIKGQKGYDASLKPIPTWEGLCHAWAPATLAFAEPAAVTVKNKKGVEIPFGSSDVNGLLTMFLHHNDSPHTSFLGGRCEEDLSAIQEKIEDVRNPSEGSPYAKFNAAEKKAELKKLNAELKEKGEQIECRDTNAGAFHIVLTNQIALMKEGFVVDVTRDDEVWNQAVFGYDVKVMGVKNGKSKDAAKDTVKEVTITATMKYIVEVEYHQERAGYDQDSAKATVEYKYRLELDKDGNIIGGKWFSYDRPDFLWKQVTPKFEGDFTGVEEIFKASTQK